MPGRLAGAPGIAIFYIDSASGDHVATSLTLISKEDPENFVVSLAECRSFLRIFGSDQDSIVTILRAAAIEFIEGQLREEVLRKVWEFEATAGELASGWTFPKWPVDSLVNIYDLTSGSAVTMDLSQFVIDQSTDPAVLIGSLPSKCRVRWQTGAYGDTTATDKLLVLQVIADYYQQREASGGARDLSIGTKLLLEGRNKHIDAVRG